MKKEVRREYEKIKIDIDIFPDDIRYFINVYLHNLFEDNNIPFNDVILFRKLIVDYILFITDNKIKFNINYFEDKLKELEQFYIENKDEEDIIKTNVINNILKLSFRFTNNTNLINLYYMNIDNLNNLNTLLELIINTIYDYKKYYDYDCILNQSINNYLEYIFNIRVYFHDEYSYFTYCINFFNKLIEDAKEDVNVIPFDDTDYENCLNRFVRSKVVKNSDLSKDLVHFEKIYKESKLDEKLKYLRNANDFISKKIDRCDYLEELKKLRNRTINISNKNLYNLNNFYLVNDYKNKSLNDIKHKKYDELCKLIQEKNNIIVIDEEGSQVEKTIENIEEELDINIIKISVDDIKKLILYENNFLYQTYFNAYENGLKLCLICKSSTKLHNDLLLYNKDLINSFKKVGLGSLSIAFSTIKHSDFQLIIVIKETKGIIKEHTGSLSQAEISYYDYKSLENYKTIIFKDEDYPLMNYLYHNNVNLYNMFKIINIYICSLNNNDILKFIKYRESNFFSYEEIFDIMFSDKDDIKYFDINTLNENEEFFNNICIKELINYLEKNIKGKVKVK